MQRMKPVIVVDETVQSDCHTTPEVLADLPPLNTLVKVSQPLCIHSGLYLGHSHL